MAIKVDNLSEPVRIAIVGKYTGLQDSYLSVIKALKHSSIEADRDLILLWVEASDLEGHSEGAESDPVASAEAEARAWQVWSDILRLVR
jgi:CTP synthase